MKKPQLIEYFDTSYERNVEEYLVDENEKACYLVSKLTYEYAEILKKEHELQNVSTSSLPQGWIKYSYVSTKAPKKGTWNPAYLNFKPKVITQNHDEILELINQNFYHIHRICSFFEVFYEDSCKRDFVSRCVMGFAITESYVPEELLLHLYRIVFRTYPELFGENKLKLLMDSRVGHLVAML